MMISAAQESHGRPHLFAFIAGVVAALAFIATSYLTNRGPAVFVPYAVLLACTAVYLRWSRIESFRGRFSVALTAYMVASLLFYVFIATVRTDAWRVISLAGHAWRIFGLMLGIGVVVSSVVALTRPRRRA